MAKLTVAQAKKKHNASFLRFWAVYPRHTHIKEAEAEWAKLMEDGADETRIIGAAQRYAASVEGSDFKYIPGPQNWLKAGQYDDADIFQDEVSAKRTWLQQQWKTANVKAVEDRYHIKMPKQYPPDDITTPDAIRFWHQQIARAWIASVAEERGLKKTETKPQDEGVLF